MITSEQETSLHTLTDAFLEENAKLNLSAFRTQEACWIGNVLDSVAGVDVITELQPNSIVDIGTGGGFPLLPLAICMPEVHCMGVDSTQKKIDAIQGLAESLSLQNTAFTCGRTEELGRDETMREQFDIVTARALAPLNTLLEYAAPFVKKGGHVIAWKSINIEQELQDSLLARAELSCHLVKTHTYELPEDWGKRQLLIFEKTSPTPQKYPREVGVPKKTPLL